MLSKYDMINRKRYSTTTTNTSGVTRTSGMGCEEVTKGTDGAGRTALVVNDVRVTKDTLFLYNIHSDKININPSVKREGPVGARPWVT